jgi:glycosyltransferase involved in cell wall biosynthesis
MWVSWNTHRRTTGLCSAWNLPLHVVAAEGRPLRRWPGQALKTIALLRRYKPDILFVQNPSLVLTVLAILTRRPFGYYLVVDGHNEGVRPFDRPGPLVRRLTRRLLKSADATIVTNAALAEDVKTAGGRPHILPDGLPAVPPGTVGHETSVPHVVVIASFRQDEPIPAILAAAAMMPEVRFSFTGDARRLQHREEDLPVNVRLTGFLPDASYWQLLASASVICDLNRKPDCLVCGAYEGLAAGKAMVLSDNPPTREIFGPASILTGPQPEEIAAALREALARRTHLEAEARKLRENYKVRWEAQAGQVWQSIHDGAAARENVA